MPVLGQEETLKFIFEEGSAFDVSNGWRNAVPAFGRSVGKAGFAFGCAVSNTTHVAAGSVSCLVLVASSSSLLTF